MAKENPLPPLDTKSPGIPGDRRYREQFGLIIICADEAEQAALFEALKVLGRAKIKVVAT